MNTESGIAGLPNLQWRKNIQTSIAMVNFVDIKINKYSECHNDLIQGHAVEMCCLETLNLLGNGYLSPFQFISEHQDTCIFLVMHGTSPSSFTIGSYYMMSAMI